MPNPAPDISIAYAFFKTIMVLHLAGIALLLLLTRSAMRRAVKRDTPLNSTPFSGTIPLMVPVGNILPTTEPALRSLLEQDFVNYRVVLITATADEEAVPLIRQLCNDYAHASHIVAGNAQRCAQKNHNLLAAVAELHPDEEILAFCDSSHLARPDFLARLTEPLISKRALLTSGYRFVRPGDSRLGTLVHMLAVQTLHMLWSIKPLTQPWGGAMAVDRTTFFDNRIPDLWSRTSVDDYSMGPYLQSLGIRSVPVVEACLETHLSKQTLAGVSNWFYRQLQFFKFHTPLTWLAASTIPVFYLGMLVYALAILPTSVPYFLGVALAGLLYARIIPNNASAIRHIAAYFLFTLMAATQLLRTWTSNTLRWQGIEYTVKAGGEISSIKRMNP